MVTKYSIVDNPTDVPNVDNLHFVHFSKEAFNDIPDLDKVHIRESLMEREYNDDPNYVVFAFSRRGLFKFMDYMTRESFWG